MPKILVSSPLFEQNLVTNSPRNLKKYICSFAYSMQEVA